MSSTSKNARKVRIALPVPPDGKIFKLPASQSIQYFEDGQSLDFVRELFRTVERFPAMDVKRKTLLLRVASDMLPSVDQDRSAIFVSADVNARLVQGYKARRKAS